MKRYVCGAMLGMLVLLLAPLASQAEVLEVAPAKAAVLSADESGLTRVALQFDLSSLRSGEGRRISEALLDWDLVGVPSDEISEYLAYPLTASWSAGATGAAASVSRAEEPAARWEVTPMDYDRNGKGFVRFDLTELVRAWTTGRATNYGILVVTPSVSREAFTSQLRGAKLTIRYGFIKD